MASVKPKRDLADFFKPYNRARATPAATVPQKRPSPPPETASSLAFSQLDGASYSRSSAPSQRPSTPPRKQESRRRSPETPSYSALTTPHSTKLAIRTPKSAVPLSRNVADANTPPVESDRIDLESELSSAPPSPSPTKKPKLKPAVEASLPISTQTVVREGKIVEVLDSDESDDGSIVSLEDLFGIGKDSSAETSLPTPDSDTMETERVNHLKLFLNGRTDPSTSKQKLRDILRVKTTNTFDASKFMEEARNDANNARRLEELKARYESSKREIDASRPAATSSGDLFSKFTNHIDDQEGAEGLIGALRRTEALSEDLGYMFFGREGMRDCSKNPTSVPPFPNDGVPLELWIPYEDEQRTRAYLTGVTTHLAQKNQVHHDALDWTFKSFMAEPDLQQRSAYTSCLRAAAPVWARNGITPEDVRSCFWSLAASRETMADSTVYQLQPLPSQSPPLHSEYLVATLDLFSSLLDHLSFESLSTLASIICQLAVDAFLMANSRIASRIEDLLEDLLGRHTEQEIALHVASLLTSTLVADLQEPTLQVRLLTHIRPTTPIAINIRITLANLFLLGSSPNDPTTQWQFSASRPPSINLPALTNLVLISDDFATARLRTQLNYTDLRARVLLLEIAISDGGRPASFPSPTYSKARDFNREVDKLAAAVRKTWSSIADTGASHMKRTEAKEKLDCVYHRLVYCVRTEAVLKEHVFDPKTNKIARGEEVRERERGARWMEGFLARKRADHDKVVVKVEGNLAASAVKQSAADTDGKVEEMMDVGAQ